MLPTTRPNRNILSRSLCIVLAIFAVASILNSQTIAHSMVHSSTHPAQQIPDLNELIPEQYKTDPLSSSDHQLADGLASSITASEWLGPLAPIAISPFFGIACLCGISQYGGEYLPLNSFISDNAVLQNPAVLWAFVILTIVTSLPRLTKVSKPIGQAIDQLEAWAGIITIVVIRFAATGSNSDPIEATAMTEIVPVMQMGMFSLTADALFSIAAIINILVINSVKFFFEVSVWLMPIPFVDAMLELANKSVCAGLMAVYAWSPLVATGLNLLIFLVCVVAFRWCQRRVTYMRHVLFDPVWCLVQKTYGVPQRNQLVVFPQDSIGPFAAKTCLLLTSSSQGWKLKQVRFLMPTKMHEIPAASNTMTIKPGLIVNKIKLTGDEDGQLLFTRRYSDYLDSLAQKLRLEQVTDSAKVETAVTL